MNAYPERVSLEGLEIEIYKLVSKRATRQQWAEWLRVPLEHAAAQGNNGLVDKLLGAGANGSSGWKGCSGRSLLHAAAVGGSEGVVSSFLRAGAQPDVNVLSSAPSRQSPLYQAVSSGHEAVARLFIMAGADVNFANPEDKLTVLQQAIRGGHEQLAKELIIGGADIEARNSLGSTPLHLAAAEGLDSIVSFILLRGGDKNAVNDEGKSALIMYASGANKEEGHLAVVETLLAAGADVNIRGADEYSALDWASRRGHVPALQALIRHGADVNSRDDDDGCSALHIAAENDQACSVDTLIEAGADTEIKTNLGRTPLCIAAEDSRTKAVLALLNKGAIVRVQDYEGMTPLHLACVFQSHGIEAVVDILLRWGADETPLNNQGRSPEELLDEVHEGRTCSQEDMERVRLLLARAPADRAWRRRGWLAMLRSRASRTDAGSEGAEDSNKTGDRAGESLEVARSGDAVDVTGGGDGGQASSSVSEVGHNVMDGVGHGAFSDAVARLVGRNPDGVFRAVLEFL